MALSGSFYGSGSSSGYQRLYFEWSATQDVANNTSTITLNMYLNGSYAINVSGRSDASETIAGASYGVSTPAVSHSSGETNWYTLLGSVSRTVAHNSDGTLTTSVSGYYPVRATFSGTYYDSFSGSASITLNTIPRASQPTVSPNPCAIGSDLTILGHRADTSFTHKFYYAFGNIAKTAIKDYSVYPRDNDATWNVPYTLANQIPSSTSGTGTIYCETYNSSGSLIGTNTCSFTVTVPNNSTFQPTVGTVTPSETVSGVSALALGKYVQGLSNVSFSISGIAGAYGSTVSTAQITFNGTTYSASVSGGTATWTTGVLAVSGTVNYSVTCTDSRGYTDQTPTTGSITILPYSTPLITGFSAKRCDVNGNLSELGTYLFIDRDGTASSLKDGSAVEKNTLGCKVEWSLKGQNSWTAMTECAVTASSTLSITTTGIKSTKTDFSITSAYDIKFTLTDKFNNTVSSVVVTVGTVMMSWGKTGVGIGKVISGTSAYALEVGGNILLDAGKGIYSGQNNNYILNDHANGNVTLSASGSNLYLGYQNTTYLAQCRSLVADGFLNLGASSQLVGDYVTSTTANKMIWTIGTSWNTWATHYGIGYEYGSFAGSGSDHQITIRNAGATAIRLGMTGNMWTAGNIASANTVYTDRLASYSSSNTYIGSGNCRIDTTGGTMRIYTSASGTADTGFRLNTDGSIDQMVGSSVKANFDAYGGAFHNGVWIGFSNEIKSSSLMYLNYNKGGSGLQVCNGNTGLGPIYGSTKSAIVETDRYGSQVLYCDESPNHIFSDRGRAFTDENGECYVSIDAILLETIATKLSDYFVYLTGFEGANVEIVELQPTYFKIKGNPNKEFMWMLSAERKGMERVRFNDADIYI